MWGSCTNKLVNIWRTSATFTRGKNNYTDHTNIFIYMRIRERQLQRLTNFIPDNERDKAHNQRQKRYYDMMMGTCRGLAPLALLLLICIFALVVLARARFRAAGRHRTCTKWNPLVTSESQEWRDYFNSTSSCGRLACPFIFSTNSLGPMPEEDILTETQTPQGHDDFAVAFP